MALLEVHNVSKQFDECFTLKHINFLQGEGQKFAVTGASGAGKTTLLKIIAGQEQATSGDVFFDGKKVIGPHDKLLPGHPQIAYLSQQYELLNNYRVEELIWFENKLPETTAAELFKICGINELLKRKTSQLSGGEKQRINLCMLLLKAPKMLVLDEPFSNLDPLHTETLQTVLDNVYQQLQLTVLLTAHNPQDTLSWANEILVLKDGEVLQQATPQQIYQQPVNEYVAGLFGRYNLIKPEDSEFIKTVLNIQFNNKNAIIRPEQFLLKKTAGNTIKGIVKKINFCGSYYIVHVRVHDKKIVVQTSDITVVAGEEVKLSFTGSGIHFINP